MLGGDFYYDICQHSDYHRGAAAKSLFFIA
jgi:hypothetical protein